MYLILLTVSFHNDITQYDGILKNKF